MALGRFCGNARGGRDSGQSQCSLATPLASTASPDTTIAMVSLRYTLSRPRTVDRYRNACQSSIGLELNYRDSIDCSDIMHSLQTVHGYHVRNTASLVLHPSENCRTHPSTSLVYQASRQSAEKRHRNTQRHSDTARCCHRTHFCRNPMPCMRHGRMGSGIAASTCTLTRHRPW